MKENWENNWKDYYQILQVQFSAEPEVVKAAYDRLAKKYHPDINKDSTAPQRMKDLNEAIEILGNPEKKKLYDTAYFKPKPVVDPQTIHFNNVNSKEVKTGSFIIRNLGGPYNRINISNPNTWVKVVSWHSLNDTDELPLQVEIETVGEDFGKNYTEQIKVNLDDEETYVRIELQTRPSYAEARRTGAGSRTSPSGTNTSAQRSPPSQPAKVPKPPNKKGLLVIGGVLGIVILIVIIAVLNSNKGGSVIPPSIQTPSFSSSATTSTNQNSPASKSATPTILSNPATTATPPATTAIITQPSRTTSPPTSLSIPVTTTTPPATTAIITQPSRTTSPPTPIATSQPVIPTNTTTTFTTNLNPSVLSQNVTLSAKVTPAKTGFGTPSGSIHFFWKYTTGNYDIATVNLDSSGNASYTWSPTYGTINYILEADYSGSTTFSASSGTINQQVIVIDTTTTFTTNLNPSVLSQNVTLSAKVTPAKTGFGTPSGSIHFFWKYTTGNYDIATVNLDSSGNASYTWSPTYGTINYILEADYSGSTTFSASSGTINQQVK